MADLLFIALSVLFFVLGAGYVAACQYLAPGRPVMTLESLAALVLALGLLVYLVYAMLRPEKF